MGALCIFSGQGNAQSYYQTFQSFQVITLKNGPNQIDLNGDGLPDLVFVAWRENFNAHGFEVISFYLQGRTTASSLDNWQLVSFLDEKGVPDKLAFTTKMGADCILSDLRILRPQSPQGKPVTVVLGLRDFGASYADDASVKFLVYVLKINKEGVPGKPLFSFQPSRTMAAKKHYCDINEAFQKELGLGWHRSDHPEEWRR